MLKLKCGLRFLFLLFMFLAFSSAAYCELDSTFLRNGEAYLSISSSTQPINGVWRLNDPEGFQPPATYFPQYLFHKDLIQNFAVDINRNIFTLSDPDTKAIGSDFKLKRQVLDTTRLLKVESITAHGSRPGVPGSRQDGGVNVTNDISDWGAHAFIHTDHRYRNNYWGYQADVYRTVEDSSVTSRSVRAQPYRNGGIWPHFLARRGTLTTAPSNPVSYLPSGFTNQSLILPHYQGKNWYEIPNGAWYSSWKAKSCNGGSPLTKVGVNYFYQTFADKAVGTQYDWKLVKHLPAAGDITDYSSGPGIPFATTYKMSISRISLAGCLDGCGGATGSGDVEDKDMIFYAAFLPYADADNNPKVRTYSYSRTEAEPTDPPPNWNLDVSENFSNYTTYGNPIGIGANTYDTEWIGVSVGPNGSDYVYFMGNSVIQNWLSSFNNLDISAVTVSNQWNQEGGLIFAFDSTSGNVIQFTIDSTSAPNGAVSNFSTIQVNSILNSIGADASSKIDDIAADGFGNLYLALTYPSPDPDYDIPSALNWTYADAIGYTTSTTEEGMEVEFEFEAQYRKSVWKISNMGQEPEEIGNVEIAVRPYTRTIYTSPAGVAALPPSNSLPADIDSLVASWATEELDFDPGIFDWLVAGSRLAVINAPTPPKVLGIYGYNSYVDIIGPYKDEIPIPDPTTKSTKQNSLPRASGLLDLSQLYFYQVENYPLPGPHGSAQDPTVEPDYDDDGRVSGFLSTITNSNPGSASPNVRYTWNTWLVWRLSSDVNGNPIIEPVDPPAPSNPDEIKTGFSHAFYSPVTAGFVITCKVQYDWWNYDELQFGQLKDYWDAHPSLGREYNEWAIPSAPGVDGDGAPNVSNTTNRLYDVLDVVFADYNGSDLSTIKSTAADEILGTTPFAYYAIEGVIASGTQPDSPPPANEITRIQRCNPGAANNPLVKTNWNPSADGVMNPSGGYHGLQAGVEYRWRLDVASQAVFFDDLSETSGLPAYNYSAPAPEYYYYQYLADKLTDKDHPYFVNVSPHDPSFDPDDSSQFASGKSTLRFMNRGDDIRWAPGSVVEVEAYIKYMTPTSADPIQYNIQTSDFVEASYEDNGVTHRFNYVAIPGDVFPPTDPTVATLTIKIRRGFVVDMYGFNPDDGNPLSSSPIYQQQKYLTLTGETNILVVDTNSPRIAFSQTTPKQLYGETGKLLEPEGNISFKLVDNNPWEASAANSHDDYDIANIDLNNTTTANISNAGASSENLLPVFSSSNRFLEFSYEVSQAASDMTITLATHTFSPGWGQKVAELVPGQTSDEGLSGIAAPTIVAEVNSNARVFKSIFSFVHAANRLGNSGSPLQIPINYANNTPGYRPYQFYVEAMDSSGNHLPLTRLNLVLHVKDTLPPNPYVMIEEFKNNVVTRAPSLTSITDPADNDDWRNQFANQTAFSQYFDYGNWSADEDGFIAAFGTANLSALPYINGDDEKIVALRTGTIKDTIVTTIAPGDLMLEDNVEVLFTIGAVDNAGVASASLEYSIYNISKEETPRSISMFEAWKSAGITDSIGSYTATSRAVFREGGDIEFPIAVPIMMTADDDARDWDSYPNEDHNDNFQWSDWGTLEEGNPDSNSRDFDTSLPVYGSQLQIRTIDRGIRPH